MTSMCDVHIDLLCQAGGTLSLGRRTSTDAGDVLT